MSLTLLNGSDCKFIKKIWHNYNKTVEEKEGERERVHLPSMFLQFQLNSIRTCSWYHWGRHLNPHCRRRLLFHPSYILEWVREQCTFPFSFILFYFISFDFVVSIHGGDLALSPEMLRVNITCRLKSNLNSTHSLSFLLYFFFF